jgi:hypothetical protein
MEVPTPSNTGATHLPYHRLAERGSGLASCFTHRPDSRAARIRTRAHGAGVVRGSRRPDVKHSTSTATSWGTLPFAFVDHGPGHARRTQRNLQSVLRRSELVPHECIAGSPFEMLAAGCIPVVNDSPSQPDRPRQQSLSFVMHFSLPARFGVGDGSRGEHGGLRLVVSRRRQRACARPPGTTRERRSMRLLRKSAGRVARFAGTDRTDPPYPSVSIHL